MAKKISLIILCVLLAAVAATVVALGLISEKPDSGVQAGTEQTNTGSASSGNGNGGSASGGGSSTNNGTSSNGSSSSNSSTSGGSTSSNGSGSTNGGSSSGGSGSNSAVPAHTCHYVYFSTVPATCTDQGYDLHKCDVYSNCPNTQQKNVKKASGHNYQTTDVKKATCISDWSMTEECSKCGDIKVTTVENSKTGHSYSWTTKQAATCTLDGLEEGICSVCSAVDYKTVDAHGHSYGEYKSNGDATCLKDGTETAECSTCHEKVTQSAYGSMLGHAFENYTLVTEKTCTQNETKKATCERAGCNATDTKVTSRAEGHDYKLYSMLDGGGCGKMTTLKYKCDVCGDFDTETKILEHDIQHGRCHWCGGFENPKLSDSGDYWVGSTDMGSLNFTIDGKECAPWEGCYGTTDVWFVINSRDGDRISFTVFVHQQNTRVAYGADFEYGQLRDEGLGFKGAEFEAVFTNLETGEEVTFKFDASYRISDDGQYAEFMIHGSYFYRDDEGNDHYDHCHASFIRIILDTI